MNRDVKRQIVYGAIYIGLMVAIPGLPLSGLKFIGGIIRGVVEGVAGSIDIDWSFLNPFKK